MSVIDVGIHTEISTEDLLHNLLEILGKLGVLVQREDGLIVKLLLNPLHEQVKIDRGTESTQRERVGRR